MGIAVWSPRLETHGNSYRGVRFFEAICERFSLSIFDQLLASNSPKIDPTVVMAFERADGRVGARADERAETRAG